MSAIRMTLNDGTKFWNYIDWNDLATTVGSISGGVLTSGTLFDLLTEVVDSDGSGQSIVRGDVNRDRDRYDDGRYMTSNDALRVLQFGSGVYGSLTDAQYDHILNYILYNEDLQKYYGAPSNWTVDASAGAIFFDADTGDTVPSIATASGPLLFKHGTISATLDEDVIQTAVTFDTPFPTALYGIQLQVKLNAGTTMDAFEAYVRTSDVNGFTWQIASQVSTNFGTGTIYWLAYGN